MCGPAASGAVEPELPDVVVLEVGVDEVPQGRPLGAEGARWRCHARGGRSSRFRAGSWTRFLLVVAAAGRRCPSTFALVGATGKWNVRRDGTAMWGKPRVAAECTCTEREFGQCSRPTVRSGRTVNDDRDHADGSDTRPRGRRTGIVKLTKSSSIDPQDTGLQPVANP